MTKFLETCAMGKEGGFSRYLKLLHLPHWTPLSPICTVLIVRLKLGQVSIVLGNLKRENSGHQWYFSCPCFYITVLQYLIIYCYTYYIQRSLIQPDVYVCQTNLASLTLILPGAPSPVPNKIKICTKKIKICTFCT